MEEPRHSVDCNLPLPNLKPRDKPSGLAKPRRSKKEERSPRSLQVPFPRGVLKAPTIKKPRLQEPAEQGAPLVLSDLQYLVGSEYGEGQRDHSPVTTVSLMASEHASQKLVADARPPAKIHAFANFGRCRGYSIFQYRCIPRGYLPQAAAGAY
eukprot:2429195-Amphidinium_carterae.4